MKSILSHVKAPVLAIAFPPLLCAQGPLRYAGYLGDGTPDGLAVDAQGSAYVVGSSRSADLPTTPDAFQPERNPKICLAIAFHTSSVFPCGDVFVAKMNPEGSAFDYFTYIGGDGVDSGADIAVDAEGAAYVLAYSSAGAMPTTPGVLQPLPGASNVWIGKLDPRGRLAWGTYLGSISALATSLVVDGEGSAYIAGYTADEDLPTTPGAIQRGKHPGVGGRAHTDGFVVKLSQDASEILYATYLGGAGQDEVTDIALAPDGSVVLGGATRSEDFPVTPGALQATFPAQAPNTTGFVAKISADGSELVYATYLGGSGEERVTSVAVDGAGSAIATGNRYSEDFPFTEGVLRTGSEGFLVKLDPKGGSVYAADVGGSDSSVAADAEGYAYLTPRVRAGTPLTDNAVSSCGPSDAAGMLGEAALKISPDGRYVAYGTYISNFGGSPPHVAVGPGGSIVVTSRVLDRSLPATPGSPFVTSPDGSSVLLARIDPAGEGRMLHASAIRNGASYEGGAASPGEWMTIFHPPFELDEESLAMLDEHGHAPRELVAMRVLFDGAPAPLIYVSRCQINVVAPFRLARAEETQVVIEYGSERSNPITLPVVETAPGLFSESATGTGFAAALNEDSSVNTSIRRAAKGAVVTVFGTGAGLLDPPARDGEVPEPAVDGIAADVRVLVKGLDNEWIEAETLYAGPVAGAIAGLIRIDLRVPATIRVSMQPILPDPVLVKWIVGGQESRPLGIWVIP